MKTTFKTDFQVEREKRDMSLCAEYNELASVPGRSKVEILKFLAKKYNIANISTIYAIRKRVAKMMEDAE